VERAVERSIREFARPVTAVRGGGISADGENVALGAVHRNHQYFLPVQPGPKLLALVSRAMADRQVGSVLILAAPISAQLCVEEGFIGLQVGGDATPICGVQKP
jgi:hypothetical protein